MMYVKMWVSRGCSKATMWMVDVGLLLVVLITGCVCYASIPQLNHSLPSWTLVFLVPASVRMVRIRFVGLEKEVVVSLIHLWLFVPYRFRRQPVKGVTTGRSSDDLDEDDEVDLFSGDGERLTISVREGGAEKVGCWIRDTVEHLKRK